MRGPPRWRAQVAPGPAAGRGRRVSRPMPASRSPAGPTLRPPIGTPAPAARTPRTASSTCWAPSARSGPTCQSPPRRHARGAAGRPRGPRGDHGALDRWSPGDDMRSAPQCSVRRRKRRRRRLSRPLARPPFAELAPADPLVFTFGGFGAIRRPAGHVSTAAAPRSCTRVRGAVGLQPLEGPLPEEIPSQAPEDEHVVCTTPPNGQLVAIITNRASRRRTASATTRTA